MNEIDFIRSKLNQEELLCQLAEEAAELSQAANKLRRAINGKNPPRCTKQEAYNNLLEECADISVCLVALGIDTGMARMEISRIMTQKRTRWSGGLLDEA